MVELFTAGRFVQSPRIVSPRFRVSPLGSSPRGHTLNEAGVIQSRTPWADLSQAIRLRRTDFAA
jgi:hypothetical protein